MKTIPLIIFLFALSFIASAHEEPSKTLHEQKEKAKTRERIAKSGIAKSTTLKFTLVDGKVPESGSKVIVQEFDRHGNMTAIEAYKNDSLNLRVEYSFDSNNNMLSDTDYSADMKKLESNMYQFDAEGRLISGKCFDEQNQIAEYFTVKSDKGKNNIDFIKYKKSDSLDYTLEYHYKSDFDNEDYIEANKFDANRKLLMRVLKKYNADGLQTEKAIYNGDSALQHTFYYEYESNGNLKSILKVQNTGTTEWKDEYSYNDHENCTEIHSYDQNGQLITIIRYEYTYRTSEPRIIEFDPKTSDYQPLLDGEHDSTVFHSGLVTLAPGESCEIHNTEMYEEMIIPLEGQGQVNITHYKNLDIQYGKIAFIPPHSEHYISNIGKLNLKYIYVATKSH